MVCWSRYPAVGTSTKRSLGERVRDYTGARLETYTNTPVYRFKYRYTSIQVGHIYLYTTIQVGHIYAKYLYIYWLRSKSL